MTNRAVQPRLRRPARVVLTIATGVVVAALALAGWLLWSIADRLLTPVDTLRMNTQVVGATPDSVTLPRRGGEHAGRYGLEWEDPETGGVAWTLLGEVLARTDSTVSRALLAGSVPVAGAAARTMVTMWGSDPGTALGLHFEEVTFPTDVGPMPAWFIPAEGSTWVIQVHGLGAGRAAGLRMMPLLHRLGYPVLAISYRNDPGAPRDENGHRQLGAAEWRDVDAAVRYALERDAEDIVLYGFSMGGAIVEAYLDRADDTAAIRGVVLDAPALDYRATLEHIIAGAGLPGFIGAIQEAIVRFRTGVRLDAVNAIEANRRRGGPRPPTLVFHGTADAIVPLSTSRQFTEDWPHDVTLVVSEGAIHTGSWNIDPESYERQLAEFLDGL